MTARRASPARRGPTRRTRPRSGQIEDAGAASNPPVLREAVPAIVLAHTTMSLDGFIAGPDDEMDWVFEHAGDVPAALIEAVISTADAPDSAYSFLSGDVREVAATPPPAPPPPGQA